MVFVTRSDVRGSFLLIVPDCGMAAIEQHDRKGLRGPLLVAGAGSAPLPPDVRRGPGAPGPDTVAIWRTRFFWAVSVSGAWLKVDRRVRHLSPGAWRTRSQRPGPSPVRTRSTHNPGRSAFFLRSIRAERRRLGRGAGRRGLLSGGLLQWQQGAVLPGRRFLDRLDVDRYLQPGQGPPHR